MTSPKMMTKTGTFFINDNMELRSLEVPEAEYIQLLTSSIIRAIKWLDDNVLSQKRFDGYYLRLKLNQGIIITPEMNKYLINSYTHWKNALTERVRKEHHRNRGSKIPQGREPSSQINFREISVRLHKLFETNRPKSRPPNDVSTHDSRGEVDGEVEDGSYSSPIRGTIWTLSDNHQWRSDLNSRILCNARDRRLMRQLEEVSRNNFHQPPSTPSISTPRSMSIDEGSNDTVHCRGVYYGFTESDVDFNYFKINPQSGGEISIIPSLIIVRVKHDDHYDLISIKDVAEKLGKDTNELMDRLGIKHLVR